MKKALKFAEILYHINDKGEVIRGAHERIKGDWSRLTGDCTYIYGDVSNIYGELKIRDFPAVDYQFSCPLHLDFNKCFRLRGDVSGIKGCINDIVGDCSLISGNIDDCELGYNNSDGYNNTKLEYNRVTGRKYGVIFIYDLLTDDDRHILKCIYHVLAD